MSFSNPLIPAPPRVASGFILIAVLLDMIGFGIALTVLPSLIGAMAGPSAVGLINGAFVGIWALTQFVAAPVLGSLSDRFGRRPLILASMAGLGLDYVMMALAPNLAWLLIGRVISALTSSSFSICYAYVTDTTSEIERAAAFGRIGAMFGLGFIIGPAVGGLLGAVSLRAPFWVAAGFSLANAVFGFLVLPESLPKDRRSPFRWRNANPLGSLRLLRSHPELTGLSITHLLTQFAGASIATVYVLQMMRRFGWSLQSVGLSMAFMGGVISVIQGTLQGRITERLGERRTMQFGLLAGALAVTGFALAPVGWAIPVVILVYGFWGLQGPALYALLSQRVSETEQGQLQGALGSLTSLADGIGPFVFGAIFAATAAGPAPGAAFLTAAAALVLALALSLRVSSVTKAE